jgi:hypothetical protein
MRIRPSALLLSLASLPVALLLAGCAGLSPTGNPSTSTHLVLQGIVHGGQQPVSGSHVYLMAANSTGYGAASVSTLLATSTGYSDSVGAYVPTASNGTFSITGDYTCTAGTQLYLYALGGNPGSGVNSAAGFLAALGTCPSNGSLASTTPYIAVNEVSTVAAAYAIAGFAVDATHVSSSGTALAITDISNAFLNATNMESLSSGAALATTPAGNGTVPQATINTIANILSSCINSTGPSTTYCTTLFANAKSGGSTGTVATDTATAAINIAHNPGANVPALFALSPAAPPFAPTLASAPNDFLLAINYSGSGPNGSGLNGAYSIAIDAHGDAWFTNVNNNTVSKLSSSGAPESPASGFIGSIQAIPTGIAIDLNEDAWVVDAGSNNLTEYATSGATISPAGGYTGGGLHTPEGIAIDGSGNEWAVNFPSSANSLSKFNSSGVAQSPSTGYTGGGLNNPTALAIDVSGNVWVANESPAPGSISKFSNLGAPLAVAPYTGGGINKPETIAIDSSGDVWTANYSGNSVTKLSSAGTALSGSSGFTGGGLSNPYAIAVDGGGNIWVSNVGNNTITELTNSGAVISPATGFGTGTLNYPQGLEIDGSGDVWIANSNATGTNAVTEFIGAAIPRVTPLSEGIKNGTLGTRP